MLSLGHRSQHVRRMFSTFKIPTKLERKHVINPEYASAITDAGFGRLICSVDQHIAISFLNSLIPEFQRNNVVKVEIGPYPCLSPIVNAETTSGTKYRVELQAYDDIGMRLKCESDPASTGDNDESDASVKSMTVRFYGYSFEAETNRKNCRDRTSQYSAGQYMTQHQYTCQIRGHSPRLERMVQIDLPQADRMLNLSELSKDSSLEHWWLAVLCHSQDVSKLSKEDVSKLAAQGMPAVVEEGLALLELSSWDELSRVFYKEVLKRRATLPE